MTREYRQPLSFEHRCAIGATMLGITGVDYRRHIEAGEKWCWGCQSWKSREAFHARATAADGLNNECRDCVNPRARETMRRVYERRRAVTSGR